MKKAFKRIVSFLLSICIVTVSVLFFSVPAYANSSGVHPDPSKSPVNILINGVYEACWYIISQMGALADGDFFKYMQNKGTWNDYWNGDNVKEVTDDNGNVISYTFSEDLVAYIKQALIEYAEETNPFTIRQTYRARDIPASTFPNKSIYNTFLAYALSHTVSAFNVYGNGSVFEFKLGDVTPLLKEGGGFVYATKNTCSTVNGDWNYEKIIYDTYRCSNVSGGFEITSTYEKNGYFDKLYVYVDGNTSFSVAYGSNAYLVTPDGGRIRVFKSLTEFMDYNAGQRKVFFGSGFYDFDPTDITATWDDINDKIGHMDDIMQDILDAIKDNPNISEEDLEKLIDELIGKIGEIGGQIGDKTDQTNTLLGGISSTLNGISSSLSGYFSSVLSYLSGLVGTVREGFMILSEKLDMMIYELGLIYESVGDMTEEEVSEKTDSLLSQLFSAFSEIGDVLKGKFPFCLPNDLYTMLALLAGNEVSVSPGTGGGGDGDIMICAYGAGDEESKAPVFEIPFVIGSADIEEKIIIDLSPFEYISKLSRTLMTLYYCACLMQLTLKVIDLGKDLGDD